VISIDLLNHRYQINTDFSWSLAIPVDFESASHESEQPNHFGASPAASRPMQGNGFIGDTEQGGSCNVNELTINPHCNGTHTETIAHICDGSGELSVKIDSLSPPPLMPCVVISITPVTVSNAVTDEYTPEFEQGDQIISRIALENALSETDTEQLQSLVVRTLPNDKEKWSKVYDGEHQPPFFSRDAVLYLNERGVEHLVLDIPSLDRLHDDGLLTCHHLFWQVIEGAHQASPNSLLHKTITEMAYIAPEIEDGFYFINLQTPAFINDAAPSRPVLYAAQLVEG
jgi:kynurenine formamidase